MSLHLSTEDCDLLALSLISGLGPRLTQALLDHFGTPSAARNATAQQLIEIPGIGDKLSMMFAEALKKVDVEPEIRRMEQHGVDLLTLLNERYPPTLRTISDPPPVLFAKGSWLPSDTKAIGIVGSRKCTSYGLRVTERLAGGLARAGYTVVSGLALGIDGAAHRGSLDAGGRTIGVHPGGLASIYPPQHKDLAEEVANQGLLISEVPMTMPAERGMFHARNRLISGLSQAVVVIEANEKSGALITARHAAEQGRDVYAIPANVDSIASIGSLQLLRDGAKLIRNIDDLIEDLRGVSPLIDESPKSEKRTKASVTSDSASSPNFLEKPSGMNEHQNKIWEFLTESRSIDLITRELGLSSQEVMKIVMLMEIKKWIRKLPGNMYERR